MGVSTNIPKGVNFYKLSAEYDNVAAMETLGLIYNGGAISKKYTNKKLGFQYYLRAAAKGFAVAQYHTGLCYLHGERIKKSIKYAVYFFNLVLKNKNSKKFNIKESVMTEMKELTKEYKSKLNKILIKKL